MMTPERMQEEIEETRCMLRAFIVALSLIGLLIILAIVSGCRSAGISVTVIDSPGTRITTGATTTTDTAQGKETNPDVTATIPATTP